VWKGGAQKDSYTLLSKYNLRELVLPGVGTLKTRELVLPKVGALKRIGVLHYSS